MFKPQEFVAGRNLPVRPPGFDIPMRYFIGVDCKIIKPSLDRPRL
jgi:hypothetical protein